MRCMLATTVATVSLVAVIPAVAQNSPGNGPISAESVTYEPTAEEPTPERIDALEVPEGFAIEVFAEELGNARMLAVSEAGNVYLTRREEGDLVLLGDGDGDGDAAEPRTVLTREGLHGIHIDGDRMYLATVDEVMVATIANDGTIGEPEIIADDIPDAGQHPNRTLAVGPDGMLYLSIGSTCNACNEPDEEHATIVRMPAEGGERTIFAEGLRNTIGFGWHPGTGDLWGVDHGSDSRGSDNPDEELNLIAEGANYGWPWCYMDRQVDDFIAGTPAEHETKQAFCETTEAPTLTYKAHSAPLQMAFYEGDAFPQEYRGDAFQVMRGSWNANPPAGYEVARIDFEDGQPASFEPFITGFVFEEGDGHGMIARLAGLAVTPGGAILISDDQNGVVYRIRHTGQ